jgi:uncharacterized damage-inducible protein DinB
MKNPDVTLLFDYLYWLRDRVLTSAASLEHFDRATDDTINGRDLRGTLVHELDVEWSWRGYLIGVDPPLGGPTELVAADYPTVESLVDHWRRDETEMRAWLADLSDADLAADCEVQGKAGYPLWTFAVHIVMHGVEQFTDAAVLLTRAGHSPGDLEYLDFWDSRLDRPAED